MIVGKSEFIYCNVVHYQQIDMLGVKVDTVDPNGPSEVNNCLVDTLWCVLGLQNIMNRYKCNFY